MSIGLIALGVLVTAIMFWPVLMLIWLILMAAWKVSSAVFWFCRGAWWELTGNYPDHVIRREIEKYERRERKRELNSNLRNG